MSLSQTLPTLAIKRESFVARNWPLLAVGLLMTLLTVFGTHAATTTGIVLQPAFDMLNEMVAGYGKQLIILVAFAMAMISLIAMNAASVFMKFVGLAIFAGIAFTAAITLSGALI